MQLNILQCPGWRLPASHTTENYLFWNINSTEVEKPWLRLIRPSLRLGCNSWWGVTYSAHCKLFFQNLLLCWRFKFQRGFVWLGLVHLPTHRLIECKAPWLTSSPPTGRSWHRKWEGMLNKQNKTKKPTSTSQRSLSSWCCWRGQVSCLNWKPTKLWCAFAVTLPSKKKRETSQNEIGEGKSMQHPGMIRGRSGERKSMIHVNLTSKMVVIHSFPRGMASTLPHPWIRPGLDLVSVLTSRAWWKWCWASSGLPATCSPEPPRKESRLLQWEGTEMPSWMSSPSQEDVNPSSHLLATAREKPSENRLSESSQPTEHVSKNNKPLFLSHYIWRWFVMHQLIARTIYKNNMHI